MRLNGYPFEVDFRPLVARPLRDPLKDLFRDLERPPSYIKQMETNMSNPQEPIIDTDPDVESYQEPNTSNIQEPNTTNIQEPNTTNAQEPNTIGE